MERTGNRAIRRGRAVVLAALSATAATAMKPTHLTEARLHAATELMTGFAERTGVDSDRPARRYLWTDAFAVCNLLGLASTTGDARFRELALELVDQVHHTLGHFRDDDPRNGWISGLGSEEGEAHPTRGGLRIGKPLPERGPDDRFDERLEWERDGQYFHYLTRWMHALDQTARATEAPRFNLWARELAATAHRAFTYRPAGGGRPRMYWKMSIDLTRSLVPSMGQHDPLDGLVTVLQLRHTALQLAGEPEAPRLEEAKADFVRMTEGRDWSTTDPLGTGTLLIDASRLGQLAAEGAPVDPELVETMLSSALRGLRAFEGSGELDRPAATRLAFRELGIAIGLGTVEYLHRAVETQPGLLEGALGIRDRIAAVEHFQPLGEQIVVFWLDPGHRGDAAWSEHRDIDEVMLATALVPLGCGLLPAVDRRSKGGR